MAYTNDQKVDLLFKKYIFGKTKTGSVSANTAGGSPKSPQQESISSPLVVPSASVWNQSDDIPQLPPTTDGVTGVVHAYTTTGAFQLTEDPTVTSGRTFLCSTVQGDANSSIANNWIDPGNFGPSYAVKVFVGDPNSGGTELFDVANNNNWLFDYSAGVLNFGDTSRPNITDLYIVGYRYVGETGAGGGSASITISDTAPAEPEPGAMWWHSTTGDLLIYYDDGLADGGNQGPTAQWVSALSGGGGFFTLSGSTITTPYTISAAGKSFQIDHPLPELKETTDLVYVSAEGPSADLLFHGKVRLSNGKATVNIDDNSNQTEGTFEILCRDAKCFTENLSDWTPVRGKVVGNKVIIEAKDVDCDAEIDWMVIGIRKDPDVSIIETHREDGEFYPEVLKKESSQNRTTQPITIRGLKAN